MRMPHPGRKQAGVVGEKAVDWHRWQLNLSSPVVLFGRNDKPKAYRSVLLFFFGSVVNSANAATGESSIQENRAKFSSEDLAIFKEQAKKLESRRKPDNQDSDALEKLGMRA
ncbi:MAG: hypothetical protein ACLSE8_04310 [Parasutterella sp.]